MLTKSCLMSWNSLYFLSFLLTLTSSHVLRGFGSQVANPSVRPQFVSQTRSLSQPLSLPTLAVTPPSLPVNGTVGCTPIVGHRMCSCYELDGGVLIDCRIEAIDDMTDVLRLLKSQPIKSFSVHSSHPSLQSLPQHLFHSLSSIEQLYISVPSLVNVSVEAFSGIEKSLKSLSLVNSELKAIPVPTLQRLTALSSLDLESNHIEEVDAYAFRALPLVSLNLQSNRIHSLLETSFAGLEQTLVELVLNGNRLDLLPLHALQRLRSLEALKMQSNLISVIAEDVSTRLSSLKSLDLHSNRIEHLVSQSFITTPNLVSLSVANNRLQELADSSVFENLLDLESLDLSYNELKTIELKNIKSLRTVDLSSNRLQDIRFENLLSLKEVFVSNNNISLLTNETFFNCSNLSVIFLQNNAIEAIDYNTFHSLQRLLTLDLSSNRLQAIDSRLLRPNTGLQSLYLDNNPFHCDCRLLSMYQWLESHSRLLALTDREDMICAEPQRLRDSSVLSLHPTDLCPVPLISLMEISNPQSTHVSIRWEVHNDSLVSGFTVEYFLTTDRRLPFAQKRLGPLERHSDVTDLKPDNWYTVCVEAKGKYLRSDNNRIDENKNFGHYVSSNRKCSQVRTLSESSRGVISLSVLGLMLSAVVFVVLLLTLSVLIYFAYQLRAKRRRRPLKASEEYITYRHFSLPSSENVYS